MRPLTIVLSLKAVLLWSALALSAAETAVPDVRLAPADIQMDAFYSGVNVRLQGHVPNGSTVLVVVRGGDRDETFFRKHRLGPIWINSGRVRVSRVPSLFLRLSQGPVRDFLSREALDRHQLDETAIVNQMRMEPLEDAEVVLQSWLTLKAQEGTYALIRDAIRMGEPGPDSTAFVGAFHWPKKAPAGTYDVRVYACQQDSIVAMTQVDLWVHEVGFPARLSAMALDHSLLYAILCVVVAAIAGFGLDSLVAVVFNSKASAH